MAQNEKSSSEWSSSEQRTVSLSLAGSKLDRLLEVKAEAQSILDIEADGVLSNASKTKLVDLIITPIDEVLVEMAYRAASVPARHQDEIRVKARILRELFSSDKYDVVSSLSLSLIQDLLLDPT